MLEVLQAKYLNDYQLALSFSDDSEGMVDLGPFLQQENRKVFQPLRDVSVFKAFKLEYGTLTWLNGTVDLAPEYLYFLAKRYDARLQTQFAEWGYI
ncbi:MAG: DUF2442 domain-containing protein [Thiomicrospira sp.]